MENSAIENFKQQYATFRRSGKLRARMQQSKIVPVFSEIILATLENDPLTKEHLTGLIQMTGAGSKIKTFDRYLKSNIKDQTRRESILKRFNEIGETGYTGKGLSAIKKPNPEQLQQVKTFLREAFSVKSVDQAVKLTEDFDKLKVPQVTAGIYSPWLHYINPEVFPIINNSTLEFRKWLGLPSDYPSFIKAANELKELVNETDHGRIDQFAHMLSRQDDSSTQSIHLNGRKLFKMSHGAFVNIGKFKRAGILKILEKNHWISMGNDTGLKQFDTFSAKERLGDYVYVCYGGRKVYAIGKIVSDVKSLNDALKNDFPINDAWSFREIEILHFAKSTSVAELNKERKNHMPAGNSTFWEVPSKSITDLNEKIFVPKFGVKILPDKGDNNGLVPITPSSKNIILYGPPGTGKTYNTIYQAVAIIEGKDADILEKNENFAVVKQRYDDYLAQERIVFTSFHQSLGYEDFIEGIKPIPPENEGDPINYQVEDGMFKKLCTKAAFAIAESFETKEKEKMKGFSSLYDQFVDNLNETLLKGKPYPLKTKTGGQVYVDSVSDQGNILVNHKGGNRVYTVSKSRLAKLDMNIADLNEVANINETFRLIIGGSNSSAYWSVLNAIREIDGQEVVSGTESYDDVAKKELINSLKPGDFVGSDYQPHVMIIDEINRGNIANIFGELITLLEDDKRLGSDKVLTVTLPYSKERFGVPPNLYVIGTMNTADRSAEALDTALRRRFSFVLKEPEPEILTTRVTRDGIDLVALLHSLNKRLKVLKDADHTIGHAWLWNIKDADGLRTVFSNKILPLLKEFFYNDTEKLGLVLGDRFFNEPIPVGEELFASFSGSNNLAGQYQHPIYELKNPDDLTIEDFLSLYQ